MWSRDRRHNKSLPPKRNAGQLPMVWVEFRELSSSIVDGSTKSGWRKVPLLETNIKITWKIYGWFR